MALDAPMCKLCKTRHYGMNHDFKGRRKKGATLRASGSPKVKKR